MIEMNRNTFLLQVVVFWLIIFSGTAIAVDYTTEHFIISSDLDPCFIECVGKKAELCYDALLDAYFDQGWDQEPALQVYYSDQPFQSEALMINLGLDPAKAENGYVLGLDCLYVSRLDKDANVAGDSLLFGGIARHFIEKNYKAELAWFKNELSSFLSKSLVVANGYVKLTTPMISCCEKLEGQIDQESISVNMRNLLSSGLEKYKSWDIAHPFTQVFFNWLYDRDLLKKYLLDVQTKGHRYKTLVEAAGIGYGQIKSDLIVFIINYCKLQKNLELARKTDDFFKREQLLEDAYQFTPDANVLDIELAKIYYENADYQPCLKKLKLAIDDVDNVNNWQALKMMANMSYRQKEYDNAVGYYEQLWKISADYPYKYRIAYQIANCYYYQGNEYNAKRWYETFLRSKWLTSDMQECEEYAGKILQNKTIEND